MKLARPWWILGLVAPVACAELLDADFDGVTVGLLDAGAGDGSTDGPSADVADASSTDATCLPPVTPVDAGPDPSCVPVAASEDVDTPLDDNCDGYSGNHLFSVGIGGSDYQREPRLVVSPNGDAVLAATFTGSVTLGGTSTVATGGGFLIELDPAGAHVWSRAWPANAPSGTRALAANSAGSVLYLGAYDASVDMGTGETLHPLGEMRQVWASFDTANTARWARMLGGVAPSEAYILAGGTAGVGLTGGRFAVIVPSSEDVPLESGIDLRAGTSLVVVDPKGKIETAFRWSTLSLFVSPGLVVWGAFPGRCNEVYVVGHLAGTTLLGDPAHRVRVGVADDSRVIIAKLVPAAGSGYVVESARALGPSDSFAHIAGAQAPDGSIVLAMTVPDLDVGIQTLELGGSCEPLALPSDGAMVVRLDAGLTCLDQKLLEPYTAEGFHLAFDVAVDSRGNAIVAYQFQEVEGFVSYLAKLDSSFETLWRRQLLAAVGSSTYFYKVAVDASDNVLAAGEKTNDADVGGGPIAEPGRLFVAKYAP